jgi:hypothetical protein
VLPPEEHPIQTDTVEIPSPHRWLMELLTSENGSGCVSTEFIRAFTKPPSP